MSARVHLVLEETDPLAVDVKPKSAARAAVLLKARPGAAPIAAADVQKLVAGSVAGLDATAVGVVVTLRCRSRRSDGGGARAARPLAAVAPARGRCSSARVVAVLLVLALLATLLLVTARRLAALERAAGGDAARFPGPAAPQA